MNRCEVNFDALAEISIMNNYDTQSGTINGFIFESKDNDPNAIKVNDGHHTMEELYEHRIRLYLALVKVYDNYITPLNCNVKCWKSRLHDDGSSFEGWFVLGMSIVKPALVAGQDPEKYDISYHLPNKYWHLAKVIELENAPHWDGYTANDVLERLLRL